MSRVVIAIIVLASVVAGLAGSSPAQTYLDWPLDPDSSTHIVSGFYGAWQAMWRAEWGRNVNYFHPAIDIPGDTMETVYAVESGYIKAVFTIFDSDAHWRIVIADSAGTEECEGWLYAHLFEWSMPSWIGQWVDAGDSIGVLATWPNPNTLVHLHFSRVRYSGDADAWHDGFWDYEFMDNPMSYLGPAGDTDPPFMQNAIGDQLFAICTDQTSDYFDVGQPISGDVDIICAAYDYCGIYQWKNSPYRIEYKIEGDSVIPWTLAFEFSGSIDSYNGEMEALSHTVFKYDSQCPTGYSDSMFQFYIMTNSDGDALLEASDTSGCWPTTLFHNGDYTISARLTDYDGNSFVDSMSVTVENLYDLTGSIGLSDGGPRLSGSLITIEPDGLSDTTDAAGAFHFPAVGGGSQLLTITRPVYETVDTVFLMTQDSLLDVTVLLGAFVCGDIDGNGSTVVDIADLVFLVDYMFAGGSTPWAMPAVDVDGSGGVDIADLVYVVDFMFSGGPAPVCR